MGLVKIVFNEDRSGTFAIDKFTHTSIPFIPKEYTGKHLKEWLEYIKSNNKK